MTYNAEIEALKMKGETDLQIHDLKNDVLNLKNEVQEMSEGYTKIMSSLEELKGKDLKKEGRWDVLKDFRAWLLILVPILFQLVMHFAVQSPVQAQQSTAEKVQKVDK